MAWWKGWLRPLFPLFLYPIITVALHWRYSVRVIVSYLCIVKMRDRYLTPIANPYSLTLKHLTTMAITYAVTKTKNPKNPDVDFFHGRAVKTGELTMEKLARRINNSTTVTQADCRAVLISMKDHIIEALTEGQVVVLDDLGRFQVTLQGKSYSAEVMAQKEFSPSSMVKGHKIVFRPEVALKKAVAADFSLKRISSEAMA